MRDRANKPMGCSRIHVPMLGIDVTPLTASDVAGVIMRGNEDRMLIVGHNLHSAYLARTDPLFAAVYDRADVVLIDGQPVRLLCRAGGASWIRSAHRVGSVDWLQGVGVTWNVDRVAVVGASKESNARTVLRLTRAAGCEVRGWDGEGWGSARAEQVLKELATFMPSLTIVGLGMPLQEHFFHEYENELPSGIIALVGGAIDQLSGSQVRAPSWMGRLGLEWLWRLARDPRRLAHRYLIEPLLLLCAIARIR